MALKLRPEYDAETEIYIVAFNKISHFRGQSMSGVSSLNLPDIVAYHELEPYGDLPEFLEIMIAMDNVFIKHYSKSE